MLGFLHAVSAGFCAALASTCAKLAMSPELQRKFWCDFLLHSLLGGSSLTSACQTVSSKLDCYFSLFTLIMRVHTTVTQLFYSLLNIEEDPC